MTDNEIGLLLAQRTIKERKVKGYTQKELEKRSGVKLGTIRIFEQEGKISLDNFIKIVRALGRVEIFLDFMEFDDEYKMLGHEKYTKIKKDQSRSMVRKKTSSDSGEEW
jgi:transcriptional regulator with XRE-family HTH domain